jgi:hypothetical protein
MCRRLKLVPGIIAGAITFLFTDKGETPSRDFHNRCPAPADALASGSYEAKVRPAGIERHYD